MNDVSTRIDVGMDGKSFQMEERIGRLMGVLDMASNAARISRGNADRVLGCMPNNVDEDGRPAETDGSLAALDNVIARLEFEVNEAVDQAHRFDHL